MSVVSTVALSAQDAPTEKQNDIMISPIELIAGPALNVSYERLLNEDSGIGLNALFMLNSSEPDSGLRTQISPYYRMYFGKKYASGFFVEGFVPVTMSNDAVYVYNYNPNTNSDMGYYKPEKNTTVGVGIGFGGKWVAKRNVVFEASTGIARRFGDGIYGKITGKGMLGIGYRF